jgi:hypothetical protein
LEFNHLAAAVERVCGRSGENLLAKITNVKNGRAAVAYGSSLRSASGIVRKN